jgi:hypothetical protein
MTYEKLQDTPESDRPLCSGSRPAGSALPSMPARAVLAAICVALALGFSLFASRNHANTTASAETESALVALASSEHQAHGADASH